MIALNLAGMDVELDGSIVKRYNYDANNNRTDEQARDDLGQALWSVPVSIYKGDEKEGSYRVTLHAPLEPVLNVSGRHPLVSLKNPEVNIWQGVDGAHCNIHASGIEVIEGAKK